jgi:dTDP-4-dehydrorhamnose reductase
MKPKTLLITGGSGYLGQYLTVKAAQSYSLYTAFRTNADSVKAGQPVALDLTNAAQVRQLVAELQPDPIIHTAAINPGQGDVDTMMRVNTQGSRYIAQAAAAVGARLVHLSTDLVFNGKNAPYTDDAPASPINDYGRSKAAAESAVLEANPAAAIVRTSLIYGLNEMDRGTAGFVERLERGETLSLFTDVIRQPVWVDSLAEALLKLVELELSGMLNVAGRQSLTRAEFGRRMLAWWQIDTQGRLQTARAADLSDTIPLDLRLSIHKAEQLLQMTFPGVDDVLSAAG